MKKKNNKKKPSSPKKNKQASFVKKSELHVVILAAGNGKRMLSQTPKILHQVGGLTLLERVVKTAEQLKPKAIHVVYGHGGDKVRSTLSHLTVNWIEQKEQLGTGHAVMQALPFCENKARVLILYGDVPLISLTTLQRLLNENQKNTLGLVVAKAQDPTGLGRIIRNKKNQIVQIVEHRDANEKQQKINEINTGILTAMGDHLKSWLPVLKSTNQQKEYYLTDIIALAVKKNIQVNGVVAEHFEEVQGVNDRWELARVERYYQQAKAKKLALAGVTVMDPARLDIRSEDMEIGQDVTIDVNVILEGKIRIGNATYIGPNVMLKNVIIGEQVEVHSNTLIEDAKIANHCSVGPFARLRPGSVLQEGAKVGNFVEMKKTHLGPGSKANHLTYLGDAIIGKNVNIGAGTITCNYDGANKWKTEIGDGAFIGSNTALVAPLKIGKNATIGAGSTITAEAPANQLTLERNQQKTIQDWQRPKKENHS